MQVQAGDALPPWHGYDQLVRRLIALESVYIYIRLTDRTRRRAEELVGRVDLEAQALARYLHPGDDDPHAWSPALGRPVPSRTELLTAAERWLRDTVLAYCAAEEGRRSLRVIAYSAKAEYQMVVGTFIVDLPARDDAPRALAEDDDELLDLTPPEARALTQTRIEQSLLGGVREFMELMLTWSRSTAQRDRQSLTVMTEEVRENRLHIERLLEISVDEKLGRIEDQRRAAADMAAAQNADAALTLGNNFISVAGGLGQLYLAKQGLSPQALQVLQVVGAQPQIVDALSDPAVQALLQRPEYAHQIGLMLDGLRQQARALAEAERTGAGQAAALQGS